MDIQLGKTGRPPKSTNAYAETLLTRLENIHALTKDNLQVTVSRMSDWYDWKVHVQTFQPGDKLYVLNLRLYQGRCPKWLRRYSGTAVVVKQINQVMYLICSDAGRRQYKIVHVDKLKLKRRPSGDIQGTSAS